MPHRLTLNSDGKRSIYDFVLESEGRNGWVKLRLIRVEDDPPIGNAPAEMHYDPEVHDGSIHYLGSLWSARGIHLDGVMRYSLVGGFGRRGYTQLEYIE